MPMSQPRYVPPGGREIDGYLIPAGTIASCQAYSVHQLNEHVFKSGAEFIPERWLDAENAPDLNRIFLAFGLGGRGCAGRHLAMAEMKCVLWAVYSRFQTRVAPDMAGSMETSDRKTLWETITILLPIFFDPEKLLEIISSRPLDQTRKLVFEPLA